MIILEKLSWSNAFSYGEEENTLCFTNSKVAQLIGKNGHGKSSIALLLEEVLYNKNSKGIKKSDIINRYGKSKFYTISLELSKNGIKYVISTKRGGSQKVTLLENGVDISAHTATETYKLIENIIGLDHKTFSQIVYQSSSASLEFLRSPDTARKKFFIELLNLKRYTIIGEYFKTTVSSVTRDLDMVKGKLNTINQWLEEYKSTDLSIKEKVEVPDLDQELISKRDSIKSDIFNISTINKNIKNNNRYKELQSVIDLSKSAPAPTGDIHKIIAEKAACDKAITDAKLLVNKISSLDSKCPTCFQSIDHTVTETLISEQTEIIGLNETSSNRLEGLIKDYTAELEEFKSVKKDQEDWEKYHRLIDKNLQEDLLESEVLQTELDNISKTIQDTESKILKCTIENNAIEEHNAKANIIRDQINKMSEDLSKWEKVCSQDTDKLKILSTLAKTFSTTGLVAYKIETLAADLEDLSNSYLSELSDGRFQISFEVSGSDKLNVVIIDNGRNIDIQALSAGETSRVNVSVLLAIRKLMNSLFEDSRINLLFLDETISTLDAEGKEKLIDLLLSENELSTILVSHEFTHPLLDKILVVKENNISKIIEE